MTKSALAACRQGEPGQGRQSKDRPEGHRGCGRDDRRIAARGGRGSASCSRRRSPSFKTRLPTSETRSRRRPPTRSRRRPTSSRRTCPRSCSGRARELFGGGDDNDDDDEGAGEGSVAPGHGSGRRMPIQQSVDVAVPLKTAYNQWTRFEDWPEFMHRLESVDQIDDSTVAFQTKIWGSRSGSRQRSSSSGRTSGSSGTSRRGMRTPAWSPSTSSAIG